MEKTVEISRCKIWLIAARPRTLIASISPVLIGTVIAYKTGAFDPLLFLFTLLAAIGIQIGTNLANDYFDFIKGADTNERVGPLRVTQAGLLPPSTVRRGFITVFALSALCSLFLTLQGGVMIASIASLSIALGILYTGGSYPIAKLGLSELFIFLFFGLIATAGTFYLQTGYFTMEVLVAGVAPGALSNCILVINNLRDQEQDRKANKKTLVVRLGAIFGKVEYILFLLAAITTPLFFWNSHLLSSITSIILAGPALLLSVTLLKAREAKHYIPLFKNTAMLLILYTLFFSLGWIM